MAVLQHEDEGFGTRTRAQAFDEQALERRLAQLRVETGREIVVRNRQVQQAGQQRRARDEGWIDRAKLVLQRRHLLGLGRAVVEPEQRRPDRAPHEVAGMGAVRLAFADRHDRATLPGGARELGDEARLAHPGLGRDADDVAASLDGGVELRRHGIDLRPAADHRQLVAAALRDAAPLRAGERVHLDGLHLALDDDPREVLEDEAVARGAADGPRHVHASRRRAGHEPRREIDRVAEARERLPPRMPVRAAAQASIGDADLDARHGGGPLEVAQLERRRSARAASSSWDSGGPNTA